VGGGVAVEGERWEDVVEGVAEVLRNTELGVMLPSNQRLLLPLPLRDLLFLRDLLLSKSCLELFTR
jgi:hypothetical protein